MLNITEQADPHPTTKDICIDIFIDIYVEIYTILGIYLYIYICRRGKIYIFSIVVIKHKELNAHFCSEDTLTNDHIVARVLFNSLGFIICFGICYWQMDAETVLEESFSCIYCFLFIFFHRLLHNIKKKSAIQIFVFCMIVLNFYYCSSMKKFLSNSQALISLTWSIIANSQKTLWLFYVANSNVLPKITHISWQESILSLLLFRIH